MPRFLDDVHVEGAVSIQPNSNQTTQIIKLAAGQTAPMVEYEDASGTVLGQVNADGTIEVGGTQLAQTLTQILTTSQAVTAPSWATIARVQLKGGGGGAGWSAAATSISNQAPGGSPAQGAYIDVIVPVAGGTVYAFAQGAGGSAGTSGVNSNVGGTTTLKAGTTVIASAIGGGQGGNSAPNSATQPAMGIYGYPGEVASTTLNIPGMGAPAGGISAIGVDGWAGNPGAALSSATNGGSVGLYGTAPGVNSGHGITGGAPTANGQDAPTPPANSGVGGCPGGAGAIGGTGGVSSGGAAGYGIIEWKSA